MKINTLLISLLLLASAGLVFAGAESDGGQQKKVTLNILHYKETVQEYFEDAGMLFKEANPNVTTEVELITGDYWTILASRDAADNMPDIWANHSPGEPNTRPWIESDKIAVLDDFGITGELAPDYADSMKIDGHLYFVPFLTTIRGLFYNEDLVKAAGFSEFPETRSELGRLCTNLKADGIVPFAEVGTSGFPIATSNFTIFWDLKTDMDWVNGMNQGTASFHVLDEWAEWFDFFKDNIQDTVMNDDNAEIGTMLGLEQAAMFISGPWTLHYVKAIDEDVVNKFRLAAVPYTDDPDDTKILNDFDLYFSVTKNDNTAVADAFLDFLVTDDGARELFAEKNRNFNPYGMEFGEFPAEQDAVALLNSGKAVPGEIFQN